MVPAVVTVALLAVLAAPAHAAPPSVQAVPGWSMVPQSKDANGDGVIDGDGGVPKRGALSREPSPRLVGAGNRIAQPNERLIDGALSWYLSPDGYPVSLDACRSSGDSYRWIVRRDGAVVTRTTWQPLTPSACRQSILLPEAEHDLALEVRSGARRDRASVVADVRNILVLSLGDSYASGEGNPRNVRSWLRRGGAITPYWDDDPCNRSARAAPALAALALEEQSRRTSVTFVHLACSGATIDSGLLAPQRSAGQQSSQVEQAGSLLGNRAVDLVLLSIGGNDVGFTSILQACALANDCPLSRPPAGPLGSYRTVQQGVQAQTAALAADLDRVAACLGSERCRLDDGRDVPGVRLAAGARVLPTLYPDITRAADGMACTYLSIDATEFAWARDTVLLPTPTNPYPYALTRGGTVPLPVDAGSLNGQLLATTRLPGWAPVTGTWSASGDSPVGHGVCAEAESWVFGFTGLTSLPSASFHPNPAGQAVLAQAITAAAS